MPRHRLAAVLALAALASALVAGAPSSSLAGSPGTCRALADMPYAVGRDIVRPQMRAWAEVHCTAAGTLALQVCAVRIAPGGYQAELKPIWCRSARARVAAGGRTFVRTGAHACEPGIRYMSYVRVLGSGWQLGPWRVCQAA